MLFADQAMCRAASREFNSVDLPLLHVVRDSACIDYEYIRYVHVYTYTYDIVYIYTFVIVALD